MAPAPTIIEDFELEVLELVEERSKRVRKRSSGGGGGGTVSALRQDHNRRHGSGGLRGKVMEGWAAKVGATAGAPLTKPPMTKTTENNIKPQRPSSIYTKLFGLFNVSTTSHQRETERRIMANNPEFNAQFNYAKNFIKTSKYTLLNFVPYNLFEQFQRLANFYFLCLLVLQLIPVISSLSPITTAVPLIGVLTVTAVKDAYDDYQRHRSDSQVNRRKSSVLRNGQLVEEYWSKVVVGDVIRMENDQFVAADVLLISTSEPNGLCYIETSELDGETNLKCKQCLPETEDLGQDDSLIGVFRGEIRCEPPNNQLNKFDGALHWEGNIHPLDNDKILLRGCILRNTQWCYGVVVFAGKDTKLMMNSGKTKFKRTSIDRLLNFIILGIVFFLLSMCLFCTVACGIWETLTGQYFRVYLPWDNLIPTDPAGGATVIALLVFFSYAIVLNTVVPISLYVSVEVIRLWQSFLINWDDAMCYIPSGTHAKARTTTLNEELGQIEYIFSDKTGTLTQNIMAFNKCTIAGRSFGEVIDPRTGDLLEINESGTWVRKKKRKRSHRQDVGLRNYTEEDADETQVVLLSAEASSDADTWVELQTLKHNNDSEFSDNAYNTNSGHCYSDSLPNLSSSTHELDSLPPVIISLCVAAVLAIVVHVVAIGLGASVMSVQLLQFLNLFIS